MADLLRPTELPDRFAYPREFIRVVELGLTDLEPWVILVGDQLRERHLGLAERYAKRVLVPFARRLDNDDVACWDLSLPNGSVVVVHDYASPGWEDRGGFPDFYSWLRQAIEDLIAFE